MPVFGLIEVEFLFDGLTRIKHLMPTCFKGQVTTMDVRQKGTAGQVLRLARLLLLLLLLLLFCWIWLRHRLVVMLQNAFKTLCKMYAFK